MADAGPSLLGKKVFFLYPPSVVKAELITRLVEQEFEVYTLRDHVTAKRLLRAYPDSIIFVNIDEGLNESEWRQWVRQILEDPLTKEVGVGILSYNSNDELARTYLMDIGARCGYIKLKLGMEASAKILQNTLNANEVKGRRSYLRADCSRDALALLNIRFNGKTVNGALRDISIVGFSCALNPDPNFMKNQKIDDIQLKMRGVLLKTEGVVFGSRLTDEGAVYVILFTNSLDDQARDKIRNYIRIALQAEIDEKAKTV